MAFPAIKNPGPEEHNVSPALGLLSVIALVALVLAFLLVHGPSSSRTAGNDELVPAITSSPPVGGY
jgi:hypothetical protein